eukprot:TRINITY_DN4773_c0_g1_i1.p2 TRINITY_DN4773_c0_g1~~TRINITY_DN4773_c0_g1_i1.p2  ORF type:complete len:100 (-),score=12.86 TRINITY_DN4773_c0_g1_i1:583-882(-)
MRSSCTCYPEGSEGGGRELRRKGRKVLGAYVMADHVPQIVKARPKTMSCGFTMNLSNQLSSEAMAWEWKRAGRTKASIAQTVDPTIDMKKLKPGMDTAA